MPKHVLLDLALALTGVLCIGCGRVEPNRVAVTGEVTLDGLPAASAVIHISPENSGRSVSATVRDGKFELSRSDGPTAGPTSLDVHVLHDMGFAIDDEGAYAAAVADPSRTAPPSPYVASVAFRDEQSRRVELVGPRAHLRIDLVTARSDAP